MSALKKCYFLLTFSLSYYQSKMQYEFEPNVYLRNKSQWNCTFSIKMFHFHSKISQKSGHFRANLTFWPGPSRSTILHKGHITSQLAAKRVRDTKSWIQMHSLSFPGSEPEVEQNSVWNALKRVERVSKRLYEWNALKRVETRWTRFNAFQRT